MRLAALFAVTIVCSAQVAPKSTPGFDPAAMDLTVSACADFYQYSCGTWLKNNPVPADRSTWGRFDELAERNREILRTILEEASAAATRDAVTQKIGDHYASCMDEGAIEGKGIAALKPDLDRIRAIRASAGIPAVLAALHMQGVNALFNFTSGQDFKDASKVIAQADQGGLGLPDRDYYFKEDAKSVDTRKRYTEHVRKMFELAGDAPEKAQTRAAVVMEMETALAKGALDRVSRRDPANLDHVMSREELIKLSPTFGWAAYFRAVGAASTKSLNVAVPNYMKAMETLLAARPASDWQTYLTWHLLHNAAPLLPSGFVYENFSFYGKTLTGAKELRPRWKRCTDLADNELGEALGRKYVERTFGREGKERTLNMVRALEKALERDIRDLPWMTADTKKKALEKLHTIANKIGYPDQWRDYSSVRIAKGDALGNSARASRFEFARQLAKIGKPIDPAEWFMTPPTVNAYYDAQMNNINFPAGILQPPFYDNKMDDAVNFGGIGAVIGHELTHGFDDQGRKFDMKGNLADWWTEQDAREFEKRASCIADQYAGYSPLEGVKLNGKLTLGENTADNGGLRIAYMALMDSLTGKTAPKVDGFTPEQRVFLGWGQIWCKNSTEEALRLRAQTDPHADSRSRVNGVVSNMPEFQQAYGCKAGQPMVRENACRVW
jgi:endothelin-converting enzyme/putative endopeptidase